MLDFILLIFRYLFLLVLYFFIFQLIKMMFRDLHSDRSEPSLGRNIPAAILPEEVSRLQAAPLPGAEVGLVIQASGDPELLPGSVFPLKSGDSLSLGRSGRNALVLTDPFASIEHATIYSRGGQYWLADKGSRNGTFLNEIRIVKPTVLADGDKIRIGSVTLQFVRWTYEMESDNGNRLG